MGGSNAVVLRGGPDTDSSVLSLGFLNKPHDEDPGGGPMAGPQERSRRRGCEESSYHPRRRHNHYEPSEGTCVGNSQGSRRDSVGVEVPPWNSEELPEPASGTAKTTGGCETSRFGERGCSEAFQEQNACEGRQQTREIPDDTSCAKAGNAKHGRFAGKTEASQGILRPHRCYRGGLFAGRKSRTEHFWKVQALVLLQRRRQRHPGRTSTNDQSLA